MMWKRRPIPTALNPVNIWEHTPLHPYRSEYPRFIRPVRNECRTEWVWVPNEAKLPHKPLAPPDPDLRLEPFQQPARPL